MNSLSSKVLFCGYTVIWPVSQRQRSISSYHSYDIERGRYSRSDNALAIQRLCPYCCTPDVAYLSELPFLDEDPIIEDEAHVLSTCPAYHHVRLMLPDNLKTALLKRDYLTVFALMSVMSSHQTAFMMGKATW